MAEQTLKGRLHVHFEQGYEGPPWAFQDKKYITANESFFSCTQCNLYWDKNKHKTYEELVAFLVKYYKDRNKRFGLELKKPRSKVKSVDIKRLRQEGVNHLLSISGCDHDWRKTSEKIWSYDGLHILELGDNLRVVKPGPKPETLFDGVIKFGSSSGGPMPFWFPRGISKEDWTKLFQEPLIGDYILKAELVPAASLEVKIAVHRLMPGHSLVEIKSSKEVSDENLFKSGRGYLIDVDFYFPDPEAEPVSLFLAFTPKEYWCQKDLHGKGYCICKRLPGHLLDTIYMPFGTYQPEARYENPGKIPTRLKEALNKYISPNSKIELINLEDSCGGLFSFIANIVCHDSDSKKIGLKIYFQNRQNICGCIYRRDKIGRWKKKVNKEERICICKNLPQDVLTGAHPILIP